MREREARIMKTQLLGRTAAFGITAAMLGTTLFAFQAGSFAKTPAKAYASARFALDLDGASVGFLRSMDGGSARANVIESRGPDGSSKKQVSGVQYQEIAIQALPTASKPLFDWISQSWQAKPIRKNGVVSLASYDLKELSRVEFFNALITETTIPACDASSKDA